MFSLMGVHLVLAEGKQQASGMCQILVLISGLCSEGKIQRVPYSHVGWEGA